jgi:hypothetical protein
LIKRAEPTKDARDTSSARSASSRCAPSDNNAVECTKGACGRAIKSRNAAASRLSRKHLLHTRLLLREQPLGQHPDRRRVPALSERLGKGRAHRG